MLFEADYAKNYASIMYQCLTACCCVLKLWCEAFMHTVSAQKLFADKKKASRQQKQAETNLIIKFARKRSLRRRLPSANSLAPRSAPADFAETWYLD